MVGGGPSPAGTPVGSPAADEAGPSFQPVQSMQQRISFLEKENETLKDASTRRARAEREVMNHVLQLVDQLGLVAPSLAMGTGVHDIPIAQASAILQEVAAKVAVIASSGPGKDASAAANRAVSGGSLYLPLKTDPVDCLVAAALLRSDFADAGQLVRLGPGQYQLGPNGLRFYCRLDGGRLMVQPEDLSNGDAAPTSSLEFSSFFASLAAAGD